MALGPGELPPGSVDSLPPVSVGDGDGEALAVGVALGLGLGLGVACTGGADDVCFAAGVQLAAGGTLRALGPTADGDLLACATAPRPPERPAGPDPPPEECELALLGDTAVEALMPT